VTVLTDPALRSTLVARGLARARQFSWAESVHRIHAVYMDVLQH
jgi:hypothetical protein